MSSGPSEMREQVLLYVAGALDDRERSQVEAWLSTGNPEAAAMLAEAQAVWAGIGESVEPVEPGDAVWAGLQERIVAGGLDGDEPGLKLVEGQAERPVKRGLGWGWAAAMAAVVGLVAAGAVYGLWQSESSARQQRIADLEQQLLTQRAEVARLTTTVTRMVEQSTDRQRLIASLEELSDEQRRELATLSEQLRDTTATVALLSNPSVKSIELSGTDEQPGAVGRLFVDPVEHRLRFVATGLPAAAAGRTYQLWFVTDPDGPVSLGVFEVGADGRVAYESDAPIVEAELKLAAVSIEPAGGVASPTGALQMTGVIE